MPPKWATRQLTDTESLPEWLRLQRTRDPETQFAFLERRAATVLETYLRYLSSQRLRTPREVFRHPRDAFHFREIPYQAGRPDQIEHFPMPIEEAITFLILRHFLPVPLDLSLNPHRIDPVPELPRSSTPGQLALASPQSPSILTEIDSESDLGTPRTLVASSDEGDLPDTPSLSPSSSQESLPLASLNLAALVRSCFPNTSPTSFIPSSTSASVVDSSQEIDNLSFDFSEYYFFLWLDSDQKSSTG